MEYVDVKIKMEWINIRLKEMSELYWYRSAGNYCSARMMSKIIPSYIRKGWIWQNGRKICHMKGQPMVRRYGWVDWRFAYGSIEGD